MKEMHNVAIINLIIGDYYEQNEQKRFNGFKRKNNYF